jgi:hypothetical protein
LTPPREERRPPPPQEPASEAKVRTPPVFAVPRAPIVLAPVLQQVEPIRPGSPQPPADVANVHCSTDTDSDLQFDE